jgi:hypothetical protein
LADAGIPPSLEKIPGSVPEYSLYTRGVTINRGMVYCGISMQRFDFQYAILHHGTIHVPYEPSQLVLKLCC